MPIVLIFMLINFLSGMLLAIGSLLLEEIAFKRYPRISDLLRMLAFSVLMFFGYRQLGRSMADSRPYSIFPEQQLVGAMNRQSWQEDSKPVKSACR